MNHKDIFFIPLEIYNSCAYGMEEVILNHNKDNCNITQNV